MVDEGCEGVHELLEAYALGALDEAERRRVEQHLERCPACRRTAHDLEEVAHALPQALAAASPVALPRSLRGRLLATVERRIERRRRLRLPAARPAWLRPAVVGVAAAVVVAGLSLAWNAQLSGALSKERSLRERLAHLVGRQEIVLDVVDSDKTRRAFLRRPEGSRSRAYGKIFTRPDLPYTVAMAARLPQPGSGHAYHLYLTRGGRTELAGTLRVNEEGFALLVLHTRAAGVTYDSARVFEQPERSTAPGGNVVLQWAGD